MELISDAFDVRAQLLWTRILLRTRRSGASDRGGGASGGGGVRITGPRRSVKSSQN